MGMPHDLMARVRKTDGSNDEDVVFMDLKSQSDLDKALKDSKAANHFLQVRRRRCLLVHTGGRYLSSFR